MKTVTPVLHRLLMDNANKEIRELIATINKIKEVIPMVIVSKDTESYNLSKNMLLNSIDKLSHLTMSQMIASLYMLDNLVDMKEEFALDRFPDGEVVINAFQTAVEAAVNRCIRNINDTHKEMGVVYDRKSNDFCYVEDKGEQRQPTA